MLTAFAKDKEGAQVIEYALIIAVLSIALIVAFDPTTIKNSFSTFIGIVNACLTTGACA